MSKILENIFEIVSDDIVDKPERIANENMVEVNLPTSKTHLVGSIIDDLKARYSTHDKSNARGSPSDDLAQILQQRYKKRGILISYDIKACFQMKRVVCKIVEDLKSLGFQDDIWFDKDEGDITSRASFTQRLESAEDCNAAIIFISRQYFHRTPSKYEAEIFIQRNSEITSSGNTFRVFVVKYSPSDVPIPAEFLDTDVDLTNTKLLHVSTAEKASAVVGALCEKLEGYVTFSTKLYHELHGLSVDLQSTLGHRGYKEKPVICWDVHDVQDWLGSLGVHERYRISFEENEIDGYLLKSLTDCDMLENLNVESKIARHKIFYNLGNISERETSWDKCCQRRKIMENHVYLVCDPVDVWMAEFIKSDLAKVAIMVQLDKGSEFSKSSARFLAEAATVVFLLTPSSDNSHVVFKEMLSAAWLEKKIITAVFDRSATTSLRHVLRAIIAKQPAIDFETDRCLEGLEVLRYHISRGRKVQPRVMLQEHYVQKMRNGLKPLDTLLERSQESDSLNFKRPKVFLSYHWNMQSKVGKIKEFLDRNGCQTTTDASRPIATSVQARSGNEYTSFQANKTPALVQDGISNATTVILCITLKYLHCDNFIKDTKLAELHKKPVLPVLLQWCPRPLDKVSAVAKRLDMSSMLIDMSNEQQFRRNLPKLLEFILKNV